MKGCELCPGTARMYCESDQASLCFDCDAMVHGANFLVARHSRSLLCRSCQTPTPWKASGIRLGPTVSVCDRCVAGRSTTAVTSKKTPGASAGGEDEGETGVRERIEAADNGDNDRDVDDGPDGEEDDDDDELEGDQESEEEEDEEGEEQVVPWTAEPPPVESSSSSEEESVGRIGNGVLKRMRGNNNVDPPSSSCSQDQRPCSSSPRPSYFPNRTAHPSPSRTVEDEEGTSSSSRPLKDRKKANLNGSSSHQPSVNIVSFGSGRPPI